MHPAGIAALLPPASALSLPVLCLHDPTGDSGEAAGIINPPAITSAPLDGLAPCKRAKTMQTQRQSVLRPAAAGVTCAAVTAAGFLTSLLPPDRQKRARGERLYSRMQTRARLIEQSVSPADPSDLSPLVLPGRRDSRLNSAGIMGLGG